MATKRCRKLEVAWKRCPIVVEGYPSNLKATRLKNLSILTQIRRFRAVTPVWIHQWLRNYAKSLKKHRRCALLSFWVIHQVSRSHGLKNQRFESSLSKITRPVAAIKSLKFALFFWKYFNFWVSWEKQCSVCETTSACRLLPMLISEVRCHVQ